MLCVCVIITQKKVFFTATVKKSYTVSICNKTAIKLSSFQLDISKALFKVIMGDSD